jgi:hypothetical protein
MYELLCVLRAGEELGLLVRAHRLHELFLNVGERGTRRRSLARTRRRRRPCGAAATRAMEARYCLIGRPSIA